MSESTIDGWAILELMGHRKLGGRVSEAEIAGAPFIRIDVPADGGEAAATQFYAPGAVYAITPTTEETARALATRARPAPVTRWELPPAPPAVESADPSEPHYPGFDEGGVDTEF